MSFTTLQAVALSVRADGTYAPFSGDAWRYAGEMTLLGMGMIFSVLAILWGVLAIFKLVFAKKPKEKKQEAPAAPAEAPVVAEEISADAEPMAGDTELIAVLTAAVAAYRESEGESTDGFRVVSFKRASGIRGWNRRK